MFRRICAIIICGIVAVKCNKEECNPSWNTPDLPYHLLSQLPTNWDQQPYEQSKIPADLGNVVVNSPQAKVIDNVEACDRNQVIRQPTIVTRPVVKTIHLPVPKISAPRVISNTCTCTKTVLVPQLYQRVIKVPTTIRYIKKSYVPVIKKINYCGRGLVGSEPTEQKQAAVEIPQSQVTPQEWSSSDISNLQQHSSCEKNSQTDWPQKQEACECQ